MKRSRRIRRRSSPETSSLNYDYYFPQEIMYAILVKLPSKSLFRFKCVSKSWRHIISDPQFVNAHLAESIRSDRKRILCCSDFRRPPNYRFSFNCKHPGDPEDPLPCFPKTRVLSSSCNGLVVVGVEDGHFNKFFLWNPSIPTQKSITFRCPYNLQAHNNSHVYGLCYSSISDEYKLVLIIFPLFAEHQHKYAVFRFKTNTWSKLENAPFRISSFVGYACCVNGAPHWLPEQFVIRWVPPEFLLINHPNMIVYFDCSDDNFKVMTFPDALVDWVCTPTNLGGRLGIGAHNRDTRAYEFWVMQEYGKKESWTLMVSISEKIKHNPMVCPPHALGVTNKGEVVIRYFGEYLIYDPVEKELVKKLVRSHLSHVQVYLDSLITPTAPWLK